MADTTMAAPAPKATVPLNDMPAPFRGVVLCCTSIEPDTRTLVAKHAEEMGAIHRYDLTSEVTHLITGNYDTPKYRYVAKERPDVRIMALEWIDAVRELWIDDKPLDVFEFERKYTMPVFGTLKICMTGFEDPLRTEIIETVRKNGGEYTGDLTKSVTHLIAKTPEGAKYKFAKQWGLRLVTKEWVFQSVERGMILEETCFHPEMAPEKIGVGAIVRSKATPQKRGLEAAASDLGARKIRRTLSTKLQSQNEVAWGDIVGSGEGGQPANGDAAESSMAQSGATSTLRTMSSVSGLGGTAETVDAGHMKQGTFSNCRFYVHGFTPKRAETMRQHLVSHDAQVVATTDLLEMPHDGKSYMVVPHDVPVSKLPAEAARLSVVTEWWVERCLEAKSLLEPTASKFDLPFFHLKIKEFEGMTVSSTGFSGYQLMHLSRVVTMMGAVYDEYFTKASTVLICNMERKITMQKLDFATQTKIPPVRLEWLVDCVKSGKKQPYKPYIVRMKEDNGLARPSSARKAILPNRSFSKEFDGFDLSMNQSARVGKEEASTEFKRPQKAAARDTSAFDKDIDEEEEVETLNSLLSEKKTKLSEVPEFMAPTDSVSAPPEPLADDDTPIAMETDEPAVETAVEPEPQPILDTEAPPSLISPPKLAPSPSKPPRSPTKSPTKSPAKSKSPEKPVSPTKPPPNHSSVPLLDTQETMETIAALLAKPRPKPPLHNSDPNQNPRRILGRAPSNISHADSSNDEPSKRSSFSRNPSLEFKNGRSGLDRTTSMGSVVDLLLAQEGEGDGEESQKEPAATQQVGYFDEEAQAEQEMVISRMMGLKPERKVKERVPTIASLGGGRGVRSARKKEGSGGLASRGTGR